MSGTIGLEHLASLRRNEVEGFVVSHVLGESAGARYSEEELAIDRQQSEAARRIAHMLAPRLAPEMRALPILSGAAKFCMIVADILAERHITLDVDRISDHYAAWTPVHPNEDVREAYAYLEERVYLDDLIHDYRKVIDPQERYLREVEVVCGLVCKWLDEQIALETLEEMTQDEQ